MRIERLRISNFKGFADSTLELHPEFTLLIGENGSGKSSVLEALAVAAGSWFLGLRGYDSRHIRQEDVRLAGIENPFGSWFEQQFPCTVEAWGELDGQQLSWKRSLNSKKGRTTYVDAVELKELAHRAEEAVRSGRPVTLPLISYYSTGRLWKVPREQTRVHKAEQIKTKRALSRFEAYRNSVDPRLSVSELVEWIARESWRAFQNRGEFSASFTAARKVMVHNVEGASDLSFAPEYGEVVVRFHGGECQPFSNLSDGQRCMLALVGDLARKAVTLNPHFGPEALANTPGLVLIDELDLHLHPRWQRHVIADLRRAFPKVQFVCTTHSPQLVSELPRECIRIATADGGFETPSHSRDLDANRVLEELMEVSARPTEITAQLRELDALIANQELERARAVLATLTTRFELGENDPEVCRIQAAIDFFDDDS
ncbi:MAG: AAA family ATPase [Myxococcota bacterium]|jgi:predicted ATP-binding protein involved in virulence|nr:AAA family ATPase [Myxococcota bacterium]